MLRMLELMSLEKMVQSLPKAFLSVVMSNGLPPIFWKLLAEMQMLCGIPKRKPTWSSHSQKFNSGKSPLVWVPCTGHHTALVPRAGGGPLWVQLFPASASSWDPDQDRNQRGSRSWII